MSKATYLKVTLGGSVLMTLIGIMIPAAGRVLSSISMLVLGGWLTWGWWTFLRPEAQGGNELFGQLLGGGLETAHHLMTQALMDAAPRDCQNLTAIVAADITVEADGKPLPPTPVVTQALRDFRSSLPGVNSVRVTMRRESGDWRVAVEPLS